jgi:hypothetical protein
VRNERSTSGPAELPALCWKALLEAELEATVLAAGFIDFEIIWKAEVFDGAPQATSASAFGTVGINFRATKP